MANNELSKAELLQGEEIRKKFIDGEWWISIIDVIAFLTDSENPSDYWYWMKSKRGDSEGIQLSRISRRLKCLLQMEECVKQTAQT